MNRKIKFSILNSLDGERLLKKGGDFSMRNVLTIILSLILAIAFTFMVSCKEAETPGPAEEPTVTPTEPAPAPEEPGTE